MRWHAPWDLIRVALAAIGRGGSGEQGQRVRDEILHVQQKNHCKVGPGALCIWAVVWAAWVRAGEALQFGSGVGSKVEWWIFQHCAIESKLIDCGMGLRTYWKTQLAEAYCVRKTYLGTASHLQPEVEVTIIHI